MSSHSPISKPLAQQVKSIYKLLSSSAPNNTFVCDGVISSLPIIEFGMQHIIKFPCNDEAARCLIGCCEKAPFGRGTDTVHDENIRNGWQLKNDKFVVHSEDFKSLAGDSFENPILNTVRQSLAPDNRFIISELYKLLVYEEGNHFKAHLDTQRSERHFATLLVFLPSVYEGGDLIVRHMGKERRFNFSMDKTRSMQCHYVAFFTDCEHEVEPVTSGYRVNLQYNLSFGGSCRPSPPRKCIALESQNMLDSLFGNQEFQSRFKQIGFVCSHQYSMKSLSSKYLKGTDLYIYQMFQVSSKYDVSLVSIEMDASGNGRYDIDSDDEEGRNDDLALDFLYEAYDYCYLYVSVSKSLRFNVDVQIY